MGNRFPSSSRLDAEIYVLDERGDAAARLPSSCIGGSRPAVYTVATLSSRRRARRASIQQSAWRTLYRSGTSSAANDGTLEFWTYPTRSRAWNRIAARELEACLREHPRFATVAVVLPSRRRTPARRFRRDAARGILTPDPLAICRRLSAGSKDPSRRRHPRDCLAQRRQVDRSRLPIHLVARRRRRPNARTPLEKCSDALARLVLPPSLGIDDNFFDAGGTRLLAGIGLATRRGATSSFRWPCVFDISTVALSRRSAPLIPVSLRGTQAISRRSCAS